MSLRLLLQDAPARAFALLTETHALTFRHSHAASHFDGYNGSINKPHSSKGMVEFTANDHVDLSDFRVIRPSGIHGTLGLININADVFLCLIMGAERVATIRPGEYVQRITSVEFHCMNRADYDSDLHDQFDPYVNDAVSLENHERISAGHGGEAAFEHPCAELKKILSGGTFYYSVDCDLTNRLQDRSSDESAFNVDTLDQGFLWNSYMIAPLVLFRSRLSRSDRALLDSSRILTSAIRGFVSTRTVPASSSPVRPGKTNLPSTLTVISRLSCRRAGTRFNSRGIDDDGNVANFVESETVLWHPSGLCFSYTQIRGSVPIFWEQAAGLIPGQQKIQITRSPEATQPAFDRHFSSLETQYGTVHILNLLSESKPGEAELTARYRLHVKHSAVNQELELSGGTENRLLDSQFDFHAETKGPGGYEAASMIRHMISNKAEGFAYFLCGNIESEEAKASANAVNVIVQQQGVFRTNCLDCLDRTNLIQTIISQMAIELFLRHREERALADFWNRHSSLWADNGDALSKIYAGTGALKSSFTRHGKMSLAGALADARKTATRMYINNFADKGRQNTIDILLGRLIDQAPVQLYDPVTDYVNAELKKTASVYSTSTSLQIYAGTFNLNGKIEGAKQDLNAWLCPTVSQKNPDIVAVGFQEIVELSPQQIMSTDPVRRQVWEESVQRTLNENARKSSHDKYILLRSGQLVGAALMVFVKSSMLGKIRNVEGSVKKTGLSGIAGNKGAVAIRMDFANTGLCFVTAHLAAGFANYEERNRDYQTISHGLHFQRNRSIDDHDMIIWLGDFNYRIGLSDEKVRRFVHTGDLDRLYQNDQLNLQMIAGNVFKHYSESKISFHPTYKYDNGTDSYDSSEKTRIPAWCDRILRKGDLKQTSYATAPLRFSDHRPVYATFQCAVSDVDESKKEQLSRELYLRRRADVGDAVANAGKNGEVDDEELLGFESIDPELPPASSDRRKWWLDSGLPARSNIRPPDPNSVLNMMRPANPFTQSKEADWVPTNHAPSRDDPQYQSPSTFKSPELPQRTKDSSNPIFEDHQTRKHPVPPPPRSRTMSQASDSSTVSSISRKPAPPIPDKPILLSRKNSNPQNVDSITPVLHRSNQPSSPRQHFPSPPRPTRTSSIENATSSSSPARPYQTVEASNPRLPPRRETNRQALTGLMDEDIEGGSNIPSLLPTSRR